MARVRVIVGIQRDRRYRISEILTSQGFFVTAVDRFPYTVREGSQEQRYICGRGCNAALLTARDPDSLPESSLVTISSQFWLLLGHGRFTLSRAIYFELAEAVSKPDGENGVIEGH